MFKKTLAALALGAALLATAAPPAAAQQVAQLACMTDAAGAAFIQANRATILPLATVLQRLGIPIAQVVLPVQFCAYGSAHVYVLNILSGNQARRMVVDARTAAVVPGV
jgi:hypothetical protein